MLYVMSMSKTDNDGRPVQYGRQQCVALMIGSAPPNNRIEGDVAVGLHRRLPSYVIEGTS